MDLEKNNEYWSEDFENMDYSNKEISSKNFDSCTFNKCNFCESTLKDCKFVDCEFVGCNLSIVKIEYSKFVDVVFRESKLIGINWTKVSWPSFRFNSPVKFYSSIVSDCSFYGLSLHDLVLEECKAHNVDFRDGDFRNSNFRKTDLKGCLFVNTNLSKVNFSEAIDFDIDVYRNKIKGAKFSSFEAIRLLDSLEIEML